MRRREFITVFGSAAVTWPLAAHAEQRPRRLGILFGYAENDPVARARLGAFHQALAKLGLGEGSIEIVTRWSGADPERIQADAAELVARVPDVIMASPAQVALALKKIDRTIPVVFANAPDPVNLGLVQSLSRPGGNITGFTNFEHTLAGKWLEVLKEIVPHAARIGVAYNPQNPAWQARLSQMERSAKSHAIRLSPAATRDAADIEPLFESFARDKIHGVVVLPSIFAAAHRGAIISATAHHRLPAVYAFRYFVADGGLLSYGIDATEHYRGAATYVDRILKGEKPADLPVQAPTKYELVINLKTAKALGIAVPPQLLARADEVIE